MAIFSGPEIVNNGLVLNFDAANRRCYLGSGTVVNNIASNTSGSTVNSPAYSTSLNGYFSFVTDDIIIFPEDAALNSQTVSVEVWTRTNNVLNQNGFWFEKGQVNSQYSLFQESNIIVWRANFGAGLVNMVQLTTANFVNTTRWFHIVATHTSGSQRIYINGTSVGTGTSSGTLATNANGMSIGAYGGFNGSRGYYYNGDISAVRVYNRVLSAAEVSQNFEATRNRYGI
jgi:hypothetical protein